MAIRYQHDGFTYSLHHARPQTWWWLLVLLPMCFLAFLGCLGSLVPPNACDPFPAVVFHPDRSMLDQPLLWVFVLTAVGVMFVGLQLVLHPTRTTLKAKGGHLTLGGGVRRSWPLSQLRDARLEGSDLHLSFDFEDLVLSGARNSLFELEELAEALSNHRVESGRDAPPPMALQEAVAEVQTVQQLVPLERRRQVGMWSGLFLILLVGSALSVPAGARHQAAVQLAVDEVGGETYAFATPLPRYRRVPQRWPLVVWGPLGLLALVWVGTNLDRRGLLVFDDERLTVKLTGWGVPYVRQWPRDAVQNARVADGQLCFDVGPRTVCLTVTSPSEACLERVAAALNQ